MGHCRCQSFQVAGRPLTLPATPTRALSCEIPPTVDECIQELCLVFMTAMNHLSPLCYGRLKVHLNHFQIIFIQTSKKVSRVS